MQNESLAGSGWRRAAPLIVIGLVAIGGLIALRDVLSFEALAANREALIAFRDANLALSVLAFVGVYVVIVAFSLPGAAVASLTGGFLFGVVLGSLVNVTAATIGAVIIFLAVKAGLGDRMVARMDASDGAVKRLRAGLVENEVSVLFLMRLVPAVPFFVANLLPGLVGVSLRNFVLTTFLGIIPGGIVYTWIGAGLGEVFAAGARPDLSIAFSPHILGPILGLCALAALPLVLKFFRARQG